jgi:hypothetical protein
MKFGARSRRALASDVKLRRVPETGTNILEVTTRRILILLPSISKLLLFCFPPRSVSILCHVARVNDWLSGATPVTLCFVFLPLMRLFPCWSFRSDGVSLHKPTTGEAKAVSIGTRLAPVFGQRSGLSKCQLVCDSEIGNQLHRTLQQNAGVRF